MLKGNVPRGYFPFLYQKRLNFTNLLIIKQLRNKITASLSPQILTIAT